MNAPHATAAADTLRSAIDAELRAVSAAVTAARAAQAGLRAASDLMDVMRAAAATVLACETLQQAAEAAEAASRAALASVMESTGCSSLALQYHTVSLKDGARFARINDPAMVPAEYVKPRAPEIDRAAVRKALLAGELVPGATLSNGGPSTIQFRARSKAP